MKQEKVTKTQKVLDYLLDAKTITQKESIQMFGCSSLAQRIQALEEKGYHIKSTRIITPNGENISRYSMKPYLCNFNEDERLLNLFVYKAVNINTTTGEDLIEEISRYYEQRKAEKENSLFD